MSYLIQFNYTMHERQREIKPEKTAYTSFK